MKRILKVIQSLPDVADAMLACVEMAREAQEFREDSGRMKALESHILDLEDRLAKEKERTNRPCCETCNNWDPSDNWCRFLLRNRFTGDFCSDHKPAS